MPDGNSISTRFLRSWRLVFPCLLLANCCRRKDVCGDPICSGCLHYPDRHASALVVQIAVLPIPGHGRRVAPGRIAEVLDESVDRVTAALEELRSDYQQGGLRILEHDGRFQMATAPDAAPFCRALLGLEPNQRLTQASLETLAIVAYRQPVSRANIEAIRGVNSDSPLSRLLAYGLVSAIGRSGRVGRPMLYGTTTGFLAYFGVESLSSLPDLDLPDFSAGSPDYVVPQLDAATVEAVDELDPVDREESTEDLGEPSSDDDPAEPSDSAAQSEPYDRHATPEPNEEPETSA